MKNKYDFYKLEYKNYIILFKCGNFYIALNDDAIVMNNVFKYKIIESANFIKSGFPISSLSKALSILDEKQINYVIVDKEIIFKNKNTNNKYSDYLLACSMEAGKWLFGKDVSGRNNFKVLKNGEVVRNLVPSVDTNGVACFYDLVSKRYFYNKGSGKFIVG